MRVCPACGAANEDLIGACVRCRRELPRTGYERTAVGPAPDLGERLVAGRYRLIEEIGRGGAGVVWRANDVKLNEDIALKILQLAAVSGEDEGRELERFKREIKTARQITHPGVVRIHDLGESGGDVFLTMEILDGGTLASRLKRGISVAEAVSISIAICEGLQAAHAIGVVHRDVKPDNVLFDDAGRPKLADFGLARIVQASTRTVGFSGTPFYMSPEHADGSEVTPQSDVYSMGVVLYEMLGGRLPFIADSMLRLVTMHCKESPSPLRSVAPHVPVALERIVHRCLEKNPGARYSDAGELAADLRAALAGLQASGPGVAAGRRVQSVPLPRSPVSASASSHRWLWGTGAFALLGIAVAVGAIPERDERPRTVATAVVPIATPISTTSRAATPAPVATGTVVALATAAAPSPTAVTRASPRNATPLPTPVSTSTVARIAHVATTPAPRGQGRLKVTGNTWAEVWIGDRHVNGTKIPYSAELRPGTYQLRILQPKTDVFLTRTIEVRPDTETHVHFDTSTRAVTVTNGS